MQSFIGWVGGKKLLARTLIALLPEHTCYVEVFGGAGWVLFGKEPAKVEVYNDLDGRLVNLFRCVKHHAEELVRELRFIVPSRELWEGFREQPGLTDIQRAARFYFVFRQSVNRLGSVFGYSKTTPHNVLLLEKVLVDLEVVRHRLARVTIERRDFEQVLGQFDAPETLYFVDPPYYGCEHLYDVRFAPEDHQRLRDVLEGLQGRWLVTYNDVDWVREAYAGFRVYAVTADYSACVQGRQPGHQLIITNYLPARTQVAAAPKKLALVRRGRGLRGPKD